MYISTFYDVQMGMRCTMQWQLYSNSHHPGYRCVVFKRTFLTQKVCRAKQEERHDVEIRPGVIVMEEGVLLSHRFCSPDKQQRTRFPTKKVRVRPLGKPTRLRRRHVPKKVDNTNYTIKKEGRELHLHY